MFRHVVTSVLVLMIRYIDLLAAEASRMRMARIARGDSPRALHQAGAIANGVGALFLRSYERGERVYAGDAVARIRRQGTGFRGVGAPPRAAAAQWVVVCCPPPRRSRCRWRRG